MEFFVLNHECDKQQIFNLENCYILTTEVKYNDLQAKQLLLLGCVIHYTELQMEAYIETTLLTIIISNGHFFISWLVSETQIFFSRKRANGKNGTSREQHR